MEESIPATELPSDLGATDEAAELERVLPPVTSTGWQVEATTQDEDHDSASEDGDVPAAADEDALDRAFERESSRRRERFLYFMVFLFGLAVVVPMTSIGVRVAMTAPDYMAPLLIQPVIVLTSVWVGGRLTRKR